VFENRVLRRILGPKRDEVTGQWKKLHDEKFHNLYSSPDIIRQIKSRKMRWAGHVARMGKERKLYKVSVGKPDGKRPLGSQGIDGRISQACDDFAATIIIGEMGHTKCRDSKNVNGFYVSRTDFLQFHIYVIS
jgi:hypothetical protein